MARQLNRSNRGFAVRTPRRKSSWEQGSGGTGQVAFTGSSTSILGLGAGAAEDGLTLVRTRGQLTVSLNAAAAVGEGFSGAFGIGIVTDQAFAAGVASMPAPITDIDWNGWLYHHFFDLFSNTAISGGAAVDEDFGNVIAGVQRIEVDSKAMRKIGLNEVIFAVLQVVEQGTATMRAAFNSRILIKLS